MVRTRPAALQPRPAAVIRPYLEEFVLGEDRDWMGQLLYGLFAMVTGGLAWASRAQGDDTLATTLSAASGFFLLCLAGSRAKARKWLRKLRRGSFKG